MTAPAKPDNLLDISQESLILLPEGATGGAVRGTYQGVTSGAVIGGGEFSGRAVLVSGRLAKLMDLGEDGPLQVAGRRTQGRLPARVTLRIYPEYGVGKTGPITPITLTGLPVGSQAAPGTWNLDNIDDASGGLEVVLPAERQRFENLLASGVTQQAQLAAGLTTLQTSLSATEQARVLLLSSNSADLRRYPTSAARNAATAPEGTWGWAADVNNYRRREGTQWVSYDPAPPPADTGAY